MSRSFYLHAGLLLSLFLITGVSSAKSRIVSTTKTVSPSDSPQGNVENIRAALESSKSELTVILTPGEYIIAGDSQITEDLYDPIFNLSGYENLTIEGYGAALHVQNWATVFSLAGSSNVEIRGLTIDWPDNLPYSFGTISADVTQPQPNGTEGYVDVDMLPSMTARDGLRAHSFLQYDSQKRRPAENGFDHYQSESVPSCQRRSSSVMRCFKEHGWSAEIGDEVIIRHRTYKANAFSITDSKTLTLRDLTVYSAPGMATFIRDVQDVVIDNFAVHVKGDRWMSTAADGIHLDSLRGDLHIQNVSLVGMGDDGLNIHTNYFKVLSKPNANSLELDRLPEGNAVPQEVVPNVGDVMQIGSAENPLIASATATVENISFSTGGFPIVTFRDPLPSWVTVGTKLLNLSAQPTTSLVENCRVERNRARGIIVAVDNATVRNCQFIGNSGPSIFLSADNDFFYEGKPAHNVTIEDNVMMHSNYGAARQPGMLTLRASVGEEIASADTFRNITIRNNTFIHDNETPSIWLSAAGDVHLTGNKTLPTLAPSLGLHPNNSCDITIDGQPWCARHSETFASPLPQAGWRYLWNATAPIGDVSGYTALQWNDNGQFDSDGQAGLPDSSEMGYGHIRYTGGHPGRSTGDGASADRYAIAAYSVPHDGEYEILRSHILPHNQACEGADGVELKVFVDEAERHHQHTPLGEIQHFDIVLGSLHAGQTVYVAVGPGVSDLCDSFEWDFTIGLSTRYGGYYSDDFGPNQPRFGWQYLWNATGDIGQSEQYATLYWNAARDFYDVGSTHNLEHLHLSQIGGHSGPTSSQGQSHSRGVIAAYTIANQNHYIISDSFILPDATCGDGNHVRLYVNDTLITTINAPNGQRTSFDTALGLLDAGDVVYVAVDSKADDRCDYFNWDFAVELIVDFDIFRHQLYLPAITTE